MTEDITSISPRNDGRSNDGIRAIDDGGGHGWESSAAPPSNGI
jgi:hypothetical protein